MNVRIELSQKISSKDHLVVIVTKSTDLKEHIHQAEQIEYVKSKLENAFLVPLNQFYRTVYFLKEKDCQDPNKQKENYRRSGCEISSICKKEKIKTLQLSGPEDATLPLAEGILLASYQFLKYKTKKQVHPLESVVVISEVLKKEEIHQLQNVVDGTLLARTLVNEPASYLTAVQFSEEMKRIGKEAGFEVEVLNKGKIESLKMGGLLSVNLGSVDPPTFSILEYKPSNAKNKKPYVLVGKGVVYDTGGFSLKTPSGMEKMKCDMAGAASVVGTLYAIAKNKIPVHVIGLIPATDNRVNGNAMVPGDVITISNGKTVEVLNTDAEGRLILADALCFASKYNPELVIDLATLTGAAARAIGKEAIVFMGNAPKNLKTEFVERGDEVFERLVEFPLWEEYGKQIESDIADIKNIGDGDGGAITAGKFLEHFVDYDWLHLDIAGPAYLNSPDNYRGKNATGVGVRLLYNFLNKTK